MLFTEKDLEAMKKLVDEVMRGVCPMDGNCKKCPYKLYPNCKTYARAAALLAGGASVTTWHDTIDCLPTKDDADENDNVLVKTCLGMTILARYTSVTRFDDFYVSWTSIPRDHREIE